MVVLLVLGLVGIVLAASTGSVATIAAVGAPICLGFIILGARRIRRDRGAVEPAEVDVDSGYGWLDPDYDADPVR